VRWPVDAAHVQSRALLLLFPFLAWLAAATSLVMAGMLAAAGELRVRSGVVVTGWFLVAAYCQFFSGSPVGAAAGLALQMLLAVGLTAWWRLGE
jgi:hypothetical protein